MFTKEGGPDKKPPAVKTSTMFKAGGKDPVPLLLPPKVRDSIFSYRKRYSEYLEKTNAENQDAFDPLQLVERYVVPKSFQTKYTQFTQPKTCKNCGNH